MTEEQMMHFDASAERMVLGAMMQDPDLVEAAKDLGPEHFYLDSHRQIFSTMMAMAEKNEAIDLLTLTTELRRVKRLDAIGGAAYPAYCTEGAWRASRHSFASYKRILREEAALRKILTLAAAATARVEDGHNAEEILSDLIGQANSSRAEGASVRPRRISECVMGAIADLDRGRNFKGEVLGISTGIRELDRCTTGWRAGELTYVGALPGRGKTSFLLQAIHSAAHAGHGVGVISLEMRSGQLMNRLAILETRLAADGFRDPRRMAEDDYIKAKRGMLALGDLPIQLCDQAGLRPVQITNLARQMYEDGAELIVVDFVQIIQEDGRDRREAINRVSAALRDAAKELDIPFVVASQLARRGNDPNTRPTMQDLRESGNLEQDAHNILMLYRPKVADASTGAMDWSGDDEILIEKQREGITGSVPVRYNDELLCFGARR